MLNTFSMQYAYFFFYSLVRSLYIKRITRRAAASGAGAAVALGTAAELMLGAVAGALAQIFTLPVAVVGESAFTAAGDILVREWPC
jgi:adenine nucleotide transporter 17